MNILAVTNRGPEVLDSNFWSSAEAAAGFYYLSANAGALRLLVPESRREEVRAMVTVSEVIITRGAHRVFGLPMAEIMFEDGSESPFVLYLSEGQMEGGFADAGDLPRRFLIYTSGPRLAGELVWYYREAALPCLRPLVGDRIYSVDFRQSGTDWSVFEPD